MVAIKDLLPDDLVIEELRSSEKPGVLREFAGLLKSAGRIADEEGLLRVLNEREQLGSTGIGEGVAIPHGKLNGLPGMILAFGRSSRGIEYQSLDARPVHLFFLIVTPEDQPGEHLKTLARISRILRNPDLRADLMRAAHRRDILRLIYEEDDKYPKPQPLPRK